MRDQPSNPPPNQLFRAAQYLRVSTEHQQYSIANQVAAIALYAAAHNIGIVRAFVDEGKSGTTIRGRKGLQELLRIVESGEADFDQVLVYDVSRWGRFPDSDEAAHYEFRCKRAGFVIRYCAEQFENDNSTTSNLLKALKRTMAGEYSRELSVKVSAGQRRLVAMGYWQGGNGPFGMQRQLVGQDGSLKQLLKLGEWKSIDSERITLTPGPPEAVKTIQLAFDLYTKRGKNRYEIAEALNRRGMFRGRTPWNIVKLRCLFSDPTYKGTYAYGKHRDKCKYVPRDKWLIREHAFPAIISEKQWNSAYGRVLDETKRPQDAEMLEGLRKLWKRTGKLSSNIINAAKDIPSAMAYAKHFGGISEAYKLIGYPLPRDLSWVHAIRMTKRITKMLCDEICERVRAIGGIAEATPVAGMIRLNQNVTVQIRLRKCWVRDTRTVWILPLGKRPAADVLIIGRLNPPDRWVQDYFVIPAISQLRGALNSRFKDNVPYLSPYRFDDLKPFIETFRRSSIREVA
jgi:DNA invertase Pin-like site-specific DNA recombinase